MRYYSEEDVSKMLAKEFDEACSYSKPYSGVKMSDYPSIEIPQTNWHTGTPTEEGWYVLECGNSEHTYYTTDYWSNKVKYWTVNRVIRWQKITPYQEEKNNG